MHKRPMQQRRYSDPVQLSLTVFGCLSGIVLLVFLFPFSVPDRDKARNASCISNVKQLTLGIRQYAVDWDENLPVAAQWGTGIDPYTKNMPLWRCSSADSRYGYAFNRPFGGRPVSKLDDVAHTILLFEADTASRNNTGGQERLTRQNRYTGLLVYGLLDGHAKNCRASEMNASLRWQPLFVFTKKKP